MRQLQFDLDLRCPTCNRPFPPRFRVSGPVRQAVVNIISHRPDGVSCEDIAKLVYASDPNGGGSANSIRVIIWKANKQLRPIGWEIVCVTRGRGSRYELRKVTDAYPKYQPARNQNAAGLDERTESTGSAGLY